MTSVDHDPARRPAAAPAPDEPPVAPTRHDEIAARGSEVLGGPLGRRALLGGSWWTPVRVIALVAIGMFALGMVQKYPCYDGAWFSGANAQYTRACYSDIPHLYQGRGFADDLTPYFDRIPPEASGGMEFLEYPVLTGLFMEVASWLTPGGDDLVHREQVYWLVNAGMLMICVAIVAVCVARTHRRRPWDALLVALAPALALTATINWDLLAVALTAAAMLAWSRSRPVAAGVLLGLATAAKLYPVLLLWPLLLLCLRAGRLRQFATATAAAAGAWLVVNLPVMIKAPDGWAKFYTFSQERGVDFGSFWLIISQRSGEPLDDANIYAAALMVLGCLGIGALALTAPRRPRFAQLAFLVVALFIVTNKVYSPQYVLWLIPLAALARPRWRDFLIWQGCEVAYYMGIWLYLAYTNGGEDAKGLPPDGYHVAIAAHLLGTLYLCAVVVRDIVMPDRDPVRRLGDDDPGGGVLDRARDVRVLAEAGHGRHAAGVPGGPGFAGGPGVPGAGGAPGAMRVRWGAERSAKTGRVSPIE
ncbi:glycosyltransferase 87 family protein [Streptomyces sp. NBC_01808]|uniref:glycosyltransferase family 87 protein n=1 Tax=Streptomyces sp. NBC_01808 TaxID=2975947 RepID=UPI002DDA0877|nr:glycosyltransferase 87 family protein [Streptomyces sp. NBC_01808]WSA39036.1 glycosyltransferase 87 family protein [Streptomyces sp. NBC_01808]